MKDWVHRLANVAPLLRLQADRRICTYKGGAVVGQAKLRGNITERVAQAKAKIESLRPDKLVCNHCKVEFHEFETMESKGLPGVTAVFGGICPGCGQTTLAAFGEPEAVAAAFAAFDEINGLGGKLGVQKL